MSTRLAVMGLTADILRRAVAAGERGRNACTDNHPLNHAGTRAWADTICSLRNDLNVQGWVTARPGQVDMVVSPDGTMQIMVAAGNEATGFPKQHLSLKYPKGPGTQRMVDINQLSLFPDVDFNFGLASETWILVVAEGEEYVRCELALPRGMDGKNIYGWAERIILEPIDSRTIFAPVVSIDAEPDIVIDVKRRRAG